MPAKHAQLDDPRVVRLYQLGSTLLESDAGPGDPRLEELADILAAVTAEAYAAAGSGPADEDVPYGLLDALAVESDPRVRRLLDLVRERGWSSWTRTRPEPLQR